MASNTTSRDNPPPYTPYTPYTQDPTFATNPTTQDNYDPYANWPDTSSLPQGPPPTYTSVEVHHSAITVHELELDDTNIYASSSQSQHTRHDQVSVDTSAARRTRDFRVCRAYAFLKIFTTVALVWWIVATIVFVVLANAPGTSNQEGKA